MPLSYIYSMQLQQFVVNYLITIISQAMALIPSFPHLVPVVNHQDNLNCANAITFMYRTYHNSSINKLEDDISFRDQSQYLKRMYQECQFPNKITLLSQYYQYHQELPRFFQKDIHGIIQNYQEEVRNLQYKFVRRKMRDQEGDEPFTQRQKSSRPVDKVIKNIQLSYYNFEKKSIKKSKEKDKNPKKQMLNRNKKSMPVLPFYQYQQKPQKDFQFKIFPQPNKETNRNSCKSKNVKGSASNSIETPKNLSRTKSKSNLAPVNIEHHSKRPTICLAQKHENKQEKVKSAQVSLSKAQSTKNIHERRPLEQRKDVMQLEEKKLNKQSRRESTRKQSVKKEAGVKNMFKKVMQTKKMIKIHK